MNNMRTDTDKLIATIETGAFKTVLVIIEANGYQIFSGRFNCDSICYDGSYVIIVEEQSEIRFTLNEGVSYQEYFDGFLIKYHGVDITLIF